jgi:citrate lyase synthetase
MNNEKTERIAARILPVNKRKIRRYFKTYTFRDILEAVISLFENDKTFKNKFIKTLKELKEES